MAEILHQLVGSLSHDLQGLYIPGGAGVLPPTVSTKELHHLHDLAHERGTFVIKSTTPLPNNLNDSSSQIIFTKWI